MKLHKIEWVDGHAKATQKPNPKYPAGIDLDVSDGAVIACKIKLPYPAKGIGAYIVECDECGIRVACTTAGRPDDPRSIKMACRLFGPS